MRTALGTTVISDLLDGTPSSARVARALGALRADGPLVISGVVYAELHARPNTPRATIEAFLAGTGVSLDDTMPRGAWAEAGRANADYHARRRASGATGVRPVRPDFLVGAHAQHRAHRLFTLNASDFGDFPLLTVVTL